MGGVYPTSTNDSVDSGNQCEFIDLLGMILSYWSEQEINF